MPGSDVYPQSSRERDRWIIDRRPQGNASLNPRRAYAAIAEQEPDEAGRLATVATIFLTNRECPWRCVMCDLWRNTLPTTVPRGAIVEQIDEALKNLPPVQQVKLYNAGSFFDPGAIPAADYGAIAERMAQYERVIVECHPALVGAAALEFRERLGRCELEIAMGLETAHPEALERLNKRLSVQQFARAARFLRENRIALRVFLMIHPPFIAIEEQAKWFARSLDVAFDCGATVISLVPTRGGNGAMEQLAAAGQFTPPTLAQIEHLFENGPGFRDGLSILDHVDTGETPVPQMRNLEPGKYPNNRRFFVDLWDLERFSKCLHCFPRRRDRLARMNLEQRRLPRTVCEVCKE